MQSLKWVGGIVVLLALVVGIGYLAGKQKASNESADAAAVIGTAIGFGQSLHKVNILAPAADAQVAIDQAYGRFASPELLEKWKTDPAHAPGQKTSSPWPQSIEVLSSTKQPDGSFVVKGNVLEVTSVEAASGGYASKYTVTLTLQKIKGSWLITSYQE